MLSLTKTDLTIGQGVGEMSYARTFYNTGWRDNLTGTLNLSSLGPISEYTASIGGSTDAFVNPSGTYVPFRQDGTTLVYNSGANTYTYTLRDGTVVTFSGAYAESAPFQASLGQITSMVTPTGVVTTWTYETVCLGTPTCTNYYRLQSVTNNLGYQLKLSYSLNGPTSPSQIAAWQTLTKVTGINNAVDYCNPAADTCSGFTVTWPSVTYALGTNTQTATDTLGRVTTYNFSSGGGLTSIQPPNSSTAPTSYTYGFSGVATATNGSGTWNYAYTSGSTFVATVTDPYSNQRVVTSNIHLDFGNFVASDKNATNNTTGYAYDTYYRLTKITQPEGNYVQYTLDGRGNATQTTSVPKSGSSLSNVVTSANYDSTCTYPVKCNQPNSVTDGNGNTTNYSYDNTYGVLLNVTPPAPMSGAVQPQARYSYSSLYAYYKNSGGSIVAASTPVYLRTGSSTCQTMAASTCPGTSDEVKTTIAYGSTGVANNLGPTSMTTASGSGSLSATTSMAYDSFGNVSTVTGPLGSSYTTQYFYDGDRERVGVVGPGPVGTGSNYPAVRYTYNADGLVTLTEQGTTAGQSFSNWSAFSSIVEQATGYNAQDLKAYDILANSGSGAEASVTQYAYDNANRMSCVATRMNAALFGALPASPLGALPASACTAGTVGAHGADRIATLAYDADGRVSSQTIASGTSSAATYVTNTYSNNGLTKTALDAMSNLTTYTYDGLDRLSAINYPVATQSADSSSATDYEGFSYDSDNNIVADRRRDGTSLNYCYDALSRLTRKDFPGSTSTNCTLTSLSGSVFTGYDLLNRLTYAYYNSTSGTGVTNTYDALSRKTSETNTIGTLSYTFDVGNELTKIAWPDGVFANYQYDLLNRVTEVTQGSGATVLAQYGYNNLGQRSAITFGNGASTAYRFDGYGRLNSLTQDFNGASADLTLTYTLNEASQSIGRAFSNPSYITHSGNVSKAYVTGGPNNYTSVAGTSYSYDARKNLTSDGTRTFTYDSENRLLTASAPTAVTLGYDPLGRLQTSATSSATTTFVYAGSFLAAEYNGSTVTQRYVPDVGGSAPVVWYQGSGTATPQSIQTDELGSVIATSNASGANSAIYGYGPNGEPGSGWSGSRYSYTGQIMIPEAQVYYFQNRIYDPIIGRFLQTDPTGYAGGMNLYAYVGNDPINATDPNGLDCPTFGPISSCSDPSADATTVGEVVVTGTRRPAPPPVVIVFLMPAPNTTPQFVPVSLPNPTNLKVTKPQSKQNPACSALVSAFSRAGDSMQHYGLGFGLGGLAVTAVAPEAGVGEVAAGTGAGMYSVGTAMKDSVSITMLIFGAGNGSGYALGKVNDALLNGIPEGPAHDVASSMLDKAEEEAGLSKGDSGSCH